MGAAGPIWCDITNGGPPVSSSPDAAFSAVFRTRVEPFRQRQSNMTIAQFRGGLAPWQRARVDLHIEQNLAERLTTDELARQVNLSPSHFNRAFKQSFGLSAHRYLVHRRVEEAQRLALGTSEELSVIAVKCGLCDQSHLTRWFRRVVGETPAAWRARHNVHQKRTSSRSRKLRGSPYQLPPLGDPTVW